MINSRRSRFTVAPSSLHRQGHPLSRTYGAILQSSLTSVLPSALDFSSRLPVSVLVRSQMLQSLEAFLGRPSDDFLNINAVGPLPWRMGRIYQSPTLEVATDISTRTAHHSNAVPPLVHTSGAGILTCCPSSTPFGLDLGTG